MSTSNASDTGLSRDSEERANFTYYFQIGVGTWKGAFRFNITSWRRFWRDRLGLKNRFLTIGMFAVIKIFGAGRITSLLEGFRGQGEVGIVRNDVRITKFGVPIYLLNEEYILNPNGRDVKVRARERFGPIPFLFRVKKEYPAEILDRGMSSIYFMPLLGTEWQARYKVQEDRNHIESRMTCGWAEAQEVIDRVR